MTRRHTGTPANPHGSRTGARRSGARPRRATTLPPRVVDDALTLPEELRKVSGLTIHTLRRLLPHRGANVYADPKTGQVYSARLCPIGRECADGYVRIGRGRNPKPDHEQYAHRIVYECQHGPIPAGYQIDHKNDRRADNRGQNLQLLTPSENTRKAARRAGRLWGTTNGCAKLTADQVRQIRATAGERTPESWAASLGVHRRTVWDARMGRTWRHVKPCPRLRTRHRPGSQKGKRP
ncbi:HNH endonuclease signature motif containing protein [Pseudoxanthomonas mexicana]|uniref:HNH endonuclease signature motif containing protein n=1 Tax=Pseudoxanthomonas mexicana TaxID=128785 RepID=UPI003D148DC1